MLPRKLAIDWKDGRTLILPVATRCGGSRNATIQCRERSEMTDLSTKHALITGGGTGVGAAIAFALADAGARVTIMGRREISLRETAERSAAIDWVTGDVTDPQSVKTMLRDIQDRNGCPDIVIANAGAAESKPFVKMDVDDFTSMLDVNLVGVFNIWREALPLMMENGWGRLIAVASTAGLKGYPYVTGYCAAKHGVVGLTRAVALEFAKTGITANAICPGFVETPMLERSIENIMDKTGLSKEAAENSLKSSNPQNRFIQPEEVAEIVLWLCGANSGSITGQSIPISGGEI